MSSYQTYTNIPMGDMAIDALVAEIPSQNPTYKTLIVRSGTSPVQPPNSVEINRLVDDNTGIATVIYGILTTVDNIGTTDYSLTQTAPIDITVTSAIPAIAKSNPTQEQVNQINNKNEAIEMAEVETVQTEIYIMAGFFVVLICIMLIVAAKAGVFRSIGNSISEIIRF